MVVDPSTGETGYQNRRRGEGFLIAEATSMSCDDADRDAHQAKAA